MTLKSMMFSAPPQSPLGLAGAAEEWRLRRCTHSSVHESGSPVLPLALKSVVETSRNSGAILKIVGSWKSSEITLSDESRNRTRQSVLYDGVAFSFHPWSRVQSPIKEDLLCIVQIELNVQEVPPKWWWHHKGDSQEFLLATFSPPHSSWIKCHFWGDALTEPCRNSLTDEIAHSEASSVQLAVQLAYPEWHSKPPFLTGWCPPGCSCIFWMSLFCPLYLFVFSQAQWTVQGQPSPWGQEMLAIKKHKARLQLQSQPHLEISVHASKYSWASFVDGTVFRVITVVSASPQPQTQWTSFVGRSQPFLTSPAVAVWHQASEWVVSTLHWERS